MRILVIGAGGVGSAAVGIAASASVLRARGGRRLRPRPGRARARPGRRRRALLRAPGWTPRTCMRSSRSSASTGSRTSSTRSIRASSCRSSTPASRPAWTTWTWRCRSRTRTRSGRTSCPARSWATRSSRRPRTGSGRAGWRWWGWAWSRACPTCSPGMPRITCSREIDEVGIRDGANLTVDGYEFAPSFSIWTTIEECLNPPVIWEADRELVRDAAVQRAGGVPVPGGHRPGRVRQRGARGGAARPALGQGQAGDLQVRPGRRVHPGARACSTSWGWTARRRSA